MSATGDDNAFRTALIALIPRLRAYALGLSGSHFEAEDLVQESLTRGWAFRQNFALGTNLTGWMFRILKNEFLNQRSRRRPFVEDIDGALAGALSVGPDQEWNLRYGELLRALAALPQDNRDALMLIVAGLSYSEAAEISHCSVVRLKGRVHRARVRLAELIDGADPLAGLGAPRVQLPNAPGAH